MQHRFDESKFESLWRSADEALQLRARTQEVLHQRAVSTFDGFGHLLDYVLPEEPRRLEHLADVLRVSVGHLVRLRASELDPLSMPREALALLGRVTGLEYEIFLRLVLQDHERFASHADEVAVRGSEAMSPVAAMKDLSAMWQRYAADEAGDL